MSFQKCVHRSIYVCLWISYTWFMDLLFLTISLLLLGVCNWLLSTPFHTAHVCWTWGQIQCIVSRYCILALDFGVAWIPYNLCYQRVSRCLDTLSSVNVHISVLVASLFIAPVFCLVLHQRDKGKGVDNWG